MVIEDIGITNIFHQSLRIGVPCDLHDLVQSRTMRGGTSDEPRAQTMPGVMRRVQAYGGGSGGSMRWCRGSMGWRRRGEYRSAVFIYNGAVFCGEIL